METSLATPLKTRQAVKPCGNPDCDRMMRPTKSLAKDYPRTVSYGADGKCSMCYRAELREKQEAQNDARHQENLRQAEAFAASRRRRGIPPEGIRFEYPLEDVA